MIQTDASMYKVKYVVMVAFLTIGVRMTYSIESRDKWPSTWHKSYILFLYKNKFNVSLQ